MIEDAATLKEGSLLRVRNPAPSCLDPDTVVTVRRGPAGAYVRCRDGHHHILNGDRAFDRVARDRADFS